MDLLSWQPWHQPEPLAQSPRPVGCPRALPVTPPAAPGDPALSFPGRRQRKDFPSNSFYVVVVVKTEDEACGGNLRYYPFSKGTGEVGWGAGARSARAACRHGDIWPFAFPDEPVDQGNRQKALEVVVSPAITCKRRAVVGVGLLRVNPLPSAAMPGLPCPGCSTPSLRGSRIAAGPAGLPWLLGQASGPWQLRPGQQRLFP